MSVPAQDGITRDNVSVRVDAVAYFRVVDPVKALVAVQNYLYAVSQVAQTSLRAVNSRLTNSGPKGGASACSVCGTRA